MNGCRKERVEYIVVDLLASVLIYPYTFIYLIGRANRTQFTDQKLVTTVVENCTFIARRKYLANSFGKTSQPARNLFK